MSAASDLKTAPRSDRTAAAILDAAAHVFSEQETAANLADVAAAAGVSRATLYRYCPNREALLKALAVHALTELASRLNDADSERATVEEAIERLARAIVTVGSRYSVLASEQCTPDRADSERLVGATPVLGVRADEARAAPRGDALEGLQRAGSRPPRTRPTAAPSGQRSQPRARPLHASARPQPWATCPPTRVLFPTRPELITSA